MTIFNTFSHNESLQIPNWTKKSQMPLFVQVGQSYSSYFVSIITTGSPRHRRSTFFPFVQNVTLHATGTRPVHPLVWPYVTIISFLGSNEKQSNPRRNGIQHGGQNIATTWHRSKWKQCEKCFAGANIKPNVSNYLSYDELHRPDITTSTTSVLLLYRT